MSTTIKHIRSAVAGSTPTTSQLALGVLAINTTDGKVFIKKSVSGTETIVEIGGNTAAEILASIQTVDGSGSGLDADKLDGVEGSGFLRSNADDTFQNQLTGNAPIVFDGTLATFAPVGDNNDSATDVALALESGHRIAGYLNGNIRTLFEWNQSNDITIGQGSTSLIGGIDLLPGSSGSAKVSGNTIWHAGNDGTGSGLDADKLDGVQGSSFLRSNQADTFLSQLTGNAPIVFEGTLATFDPPGGGTGSDTANDGAIALASGHRIVGWHDGYVRTLFKWTQSSNIVIGQTGTGLIGGIDLLPGSSGAAKVNGNTIWHAGNDGTGSGLDADKVDGIEGASFLRSDEADTFSGDLTSSGNAKINLIDNSYLCMGTGSDAELFCDGSHLYLDLNSDIGNFYIRDGTTTRYTFDDNGSFTATGNVTAYSDITLKNSIEPIADPIDKVQQINGVTFNRTDVPELGRQLGVIAQDVEKVCPELVLTNDDGIKSVAYGNMVGLLVEAVKEQQKQIGELKERINVLEEST